MKKSFLLLLSLASSNLFCMQYFWTRGKKVHSRIGLHFARRSFQQMQKSSHEYFNLETPSESLKWLKKNANRCLLLEEIVTECKKQACNNRNMEKQASKLLKNLSNTQVQLRRHADALVKGGIADVEPSAQDYFEIEDEASNLWSIALAAAQEKRGE